MKKNIWMNNLDKISTENAIYLNLVKIITQSVKDFGILKIKL
jgi:hypothetical protein